jgi:uncharacterized protein DUF5681
MAKFKKGQSGNPGGRPKGSQTGLLLWLLLWLKTDAGKPMGTPESD